MLQCSFCRKAFSSIFVYLTHVRNLHGYKQNYACCFNGCPITSSSYFGLKAHVLKHELTFKKRNIKFQCTSCGYFSYLKSKFITHYKRHDVINCPVRGCSQTYNVFSSFTSHLYRNHAGYKDSDFQPDLTSMFSNSVDISDEIIPMDIDNSMKVSSYENNIIMFILKMQEKFLLPESTITEMIKDFNELQNENLDLVKCHFLNCLKDQLTESIQEEIKGFNPNKFTDVFNVLKSKYSKHEMMKDMGLVSPVQFKLGFSKSFQYVSIIKNIQELCRNIQIRHFITTPPVISKDGTFRDIYDGSTLKNNDLFKSFPNIQIILYFDEFCVANPLRGNQRVHKLAAFYYTLGNLPSIYRSKVDNVQLALLCNAVDLKKFGFPVVLTPLLNDLKILENEGIHIDGIAQKVKGSIISIVGDNLGIHQLNGFYACFNPNVVRPCRYCLAKNNEMQVIYNGKSFVRRTKVVHQNHINLIISDPVYMSCYGLKYDSPFNELKYFHSCQMLPPDAMHDLLEGIVPLELSLIIDKLIQQKIITLRELNERISKMKFLGSDALSKPFEISDSFKKGIKMTASRIWCFLRFLPLLIGDKVPENDSYWNLLLLLRDIVDIIFAPVINLSYISYLKSKVIEHHKLFKEIFPHVTLKPKHHYLIHYPYLIQEFGPLKHVWTMRFEAKHYYFKRVAQCIKNSKNLAYSMAQRHQKLQLYYNAHFNRDVGIDVSVSNAKLLDKSLYNDEISTVLDAYNNFYVVPKAKLYGTVYMPGMCVVVKFVEDEPVFGKIIVILSRDKIVKFVCRLFTSEFISHIHAYKLINKIAIKVMSPQELLDIYPLCVYNYNNCHVVVQKHLIFDPDED